MAARKISLTVSLAATSALIVSFQNCSNNYRIAAVDVAAPGGSAASVTTPQIASLNLGATTVQTKKNQSITFTVSPGQIAGLLSLQVAPGITLLKSNNGTFEILDAQKFSVKYTPDESFIGSDAITVYAQDTSGTSGQAQVTVVVGSVFNSIQPALAVRGMSCITCHSSVSSSIITDYGYGSPWYFDVKSIDSFYYDRLGAGNGLATLKLLNNSKIVVPAGTIPSAIATEFNVSSLSEFVQARFAQGKLNTSAQVSEVSKLAITIPTSERIRTLFGNPTSKQVYIPDTQASPPLSGLDYDAVNDVFVINKITCDGDLYLGSTVLFKSAIVQSLNGCRIYTTANVFIDSPVQSLPYGSATNFNTQILSSQSIWMGAGRMLKANGDFCEVTAAGKATGYYASASFKCSDPASATTTDCDSLLFRAGALSSRNTYSRGYPDSTSMKSFFSNAKVKGPVLSARAQVEASIGHPLYDASCGASGRNVATSRLMLAAPYVNNRYTGDFSGSTIAEAALMSLGTFKFEFDPVFKQVSIFSMLDVNELIAGDL